MGSVGSRAGRGCDPPLRAPAGPGVGRCSHRPQQGRRRSEGSQEAPGPAAARTTAESGRRRAAKGKGERGAGECRPPTRSGRGAGLSASPPSSGTRAGVPFDGMASWARGLPRRLMAGSSDFAHYLRTCMAPSSLQGCGDPGTDVWPMPPPFEWGAGPPPSSSRRRARWRRHVASRVWTNVAVAALSFLRLGGHAFAPQRLDSGWRSRRLRSVRRLDCSAL